MNISFSKEDYPDVEYVEVEEYGIIKISDIPITLNKEKCHQIEWCISEGKHVLAESSGCQPICHGGRILPVIRIIGADYAN